MLINVRTGDINHITLSSYKNLSQVVPKYEFHVAKDIRKKYELAHELFSITGNVLFADFRAVREFVYKINNKRDPMGHVAYGEVNAMGLLDEIYHFILREYEEKENPGVFQRAIAHLDGEMKEENVRKLMFEFTDKFPPLEVYLGKIGIMDYLNFYSANKPNNEVALEELMLLYFANINPANSRLKELFDDNYITENKETYKKAIGLLDDFFKKEKTFGPDNQDIFEFLQTPFKQSPNNLEGQLDFIRTKWSGIVGDKFLQKILSGKDLMREDIVFDTGGGGGGVPTVAPQYKGDMSDADFLVLGKSLYQYAKDAQLDYDEPEQFTPDIDWMPRVVLLAKNAHVWLDQLSKKYKRDIKRLDQIPDEELDQIARWNFNGLWLIGLWERSTASKKIKHIMGNIDAVASAYSLYDYQIAHDLGGEYAYNNLNERAKARGIRLASDMVPNHTGVYSKWMIEHPDYFIQSQHSPFPNYQFNGQDLSDDPNIEIKIEDGYFRRSDAAVVFRRIDKRYNDVRYIYHGNDGTNMPWNDTAQLDMLKKEVREAVIQKIFEVARKFSIIRFDAAMTLAKKHFSRLWYPQPGMGGDIPSRTDYSMTREEFDQFFPEEFWREVVDRINEEMPETLLLAEAFWLLEGYFVRSLGMHRVYNSAFMHMLMKEENDKYRDLITNTLEFEPEILKRYVNFMSNPDEETAIRQFGDGDKYFGVAAMMITLPGLPMFAHGQVEGYTEKYGMEYKRAYYNEQPDQWLVERHERELFPLMRKRYLFSQVQNFWYYNFRDEYNNINEQVFAYTNMEYGERALFMYNNKYESVKGHIHTSTQKLVGDDKRLERKTLSEALDIKTGEGYYYIFKEHVSNLEYLRRGAEFANEGLYIHLNGFQYVVFLNFREVYDKNGEYEQLYRELGGGGVESVEKALNENKLMPIHHAFESVFKEDNIEEFIEVYVRATTQSRKAKELLSAYTYLLHQVSKHYGIEKDESEIAKELENNFKLVSKTNRLLGDAYPTDTNPVNSVVHEDFKLSYYSSYHENSVIYLTYISVYMLRKVFDEKGDINRTNFTEEMMIDTPLLKVIERLGRGKQDIYREITLMNVLLQYIDMVSKEEKPKKNDAEKKAKPEVKIGKELTKLLDDDFVRAYIGVNHYKGVLYYSKESFEELAEWLFTLDLLRLVDNKKREKAIREAYEYYTSVKQLANQSGYQLEVLKTKLKENKSTAEKSKKKGKKKKKQ